MRLPVDWLNEYVPNELPLRELAYVLTNMGLEVEEIEGEGGAAVLNIKVLSNRGDCLSVVGIARELAATLHQPLVLPSPKVAERGPAAAELAEVVLDDPALCPRYSARIVRGVRIGPSPEWAQRRLELCGIRAINNVVDATNLVMLEVGQPLHAFDYRLLHGEAGSATPKIIVRRARAGEKLTTIDGEERELTPGLLLITDASGPIALAGVMGGMTSEIHDGTTEVLIESAYFDPRTVRRGARALGMNTEASYRMERGIDPGGTVRALDRVCELIVQFGQGEVEIAEGALDAYPVPIEERVLTLRPARANELLGVTLAPEEIATRLELLQLPVQHGDVLTVRVPTFRQDLATEIDLIEEVARAHDYQNIPEHLPARVGVGRQDPGLAFDAQVRQVLRGQGLTETVTSSLEAPEAPGRLRLPEDDPRATAVRLANPKTQDRSQLRTTLLTSLLDVLSLNRRHGVTDVAIFDLGVVVLPGDGGQLPRQPQHLGLATTGRLWQGAWGLPKGAELWDFFALKGAVEQVLHTVARVTAGYAPDRDPSFSPAACARVSLNGQVIGHLGRLHDEVLEAWGLPDPVYAADLDLDAIRAAALPQPDFEPLSRYQASDRDVAFLLPRHLPATQAEAVIRAAAGPDLEELRLFDVYEGKPLPEGQRNLAFSLRFRRAERTLTDEELEATMEQVREALRRELGAAIRE